MKKKIFTILSLSIIAVCCLFGGVISRFDIQAAADKYEIETQTDFSKLHYGSTFTLPESVKIVVDETTKIDATEGKLTFPSGVVYGKGTHLLNETGEYILTYYAVHNAKTVSAEKVFTVANKQWTVSTQKSSASYGDLTGYGAEIDTKGILVSLAEGDVFRYNVPMNVYKMGNVVDLFKIYPNMREHAEKDNALQYTNTVNCSYVTVRLVDVYDENNYVEFLLWGDTISFYASAGWANQSPVGLEPSSEQSTSAKKMIYEGAWYNKHVITRYAQKSQWGVNTRAWTAQELVGIGGFNAQWDMTTNKIYLQNKNISQLVTDLDDPILHDDDIFTGFSTGEVFVEIQPQVYTGGQNVSIEIESLLGLSGEELADNYYIDTVAPVVEIETQKTDDMGVYASKGVEITVPECTVRDLNFQGNLKANVYYNYGSEEQIVVHLKDGKFKPTENGVYTLVYTATDAFGNEGYATLSYIVVEEKPFTYTEQKVAQIVAGETNTLPQLDVNGINAAVQVSVSVTDPKGNSAKVTDNGFFAEYLGEYTITYELKDNVYTQYFTYSAQTQGESGAYFYEEPVLPNYFVKGGVYDIYALQAYTISEDGKVPHLSTVYVSVDNGDFTKLSEQEKTEYTVTANTCVQFEYRYATAKKTSPKIDVLDLGYTTETKNYAGFFVGNYTEAVGQIAQLDYCFSGAQTSGWMEFVTPVLFNGFSLQFIIPEEGANYSTVTIQLFDYQNKENLNTIVYQKTSEGVVCQVNGGKAEKLKDYFSNQYNVSVKDGEIVLDNTKSYAANAFAGRTCLLKITLDDVTDDSVLSIKEINGQKFRKKINEEEPGLGFDYPIGTYQRGTTYTSSSAVGSGVFTFCVESATTVTITKNNAVVSDVNGKPIKDMPANTGYTFELAETGAYFIEYTAKMGEKTASTRVVVNVTDTIAPTIEFADGLNEQKYVKVKAGTEYTFASFEVSDNLTAAEDLIVDIYVRNDNFNTIQIGGTSTTFVYKGFYVIQVYCMDADGNYATAYYNVLAE